MADKETIVEHGYASEEVFIGGDGRAMIRVTCLCGETFEGPAHGPSPLRVHCLTAGHAATP